MYRKNDVVRCESIANDLEQGTLLGEDAFKYHTLDMLHRERKETLVSRSIHENHPKTNRNASVVRTEYHFLCAA
jgi:hypothetical protein